jgi:serine O-acetyltransferase
MFDALRRDIRSALERDPAARSALEVLLAYPGVHALSYHRLAHGLWRARWHLAARLVSAFSRMVTGIDIHPGAEIGPGLFIDHGQGVVIGETAVVGRDVTLYQGVTLGSTGKERKAKRHPTLGDRVLVAAGAMILGDIVIGDDAKVGAGSVVLRSVPAGATVVGVPGRVVAVNGEPVDDRHGPSREEMERRISRLERRLARLELAMRGGPLGLEGNGDTQVDLCAADGTAAECGWEEGGLGR